MTDAQLIVKQLMRIADCLERLVAPEETPALPGCQHPEEQRASFGMTNGMEDWECRLCRYRSVQVTMTAAIAAAPEP